MRRRQVLKVGLGSVAMALTPLSWALPERCHGGCLRPASRQAVLFARRPGTRMHVIDGNSRQLAHTIAAGEGYHFYGHGVFDLSGRYVYVTANRLGQRRASARLRR